MAPAFVPSFPLAVRSGASSLTVSHTCSSRPAIASQNGLFLARRNIALFSGMRKNVVFGVKNVTSMRMEQKYDFYQLETPKVDEFTYQIASPVADGYFRTNFIGGLPAYREGLDSFRRGLEIGMAHGYWLVGPFTKYGENRLSEDALLLGSVSAGLLVLFLTVALTIYGKVSFSKKASGGLFETGAGWSGFVNGWLIGGLGGATFAALILDGIARSA
mmetsp:Transcript_9721/g.15919  ORF Transcript_9721/g.15919 Transcript_9721/m.15919 type:complete len:217 (+) Transcript_9721:125-775(+)